MAVPIIAGPSASLAGVADKARAQGATDWYQKALVALWRAGLATGVDPVVLAGQCAHETGWGRFGGAVGVEHGNTAGIKTRGATGDKPDDHARFAIDPLGYPWLGALAHAHHLCLYAGVPVPADTPDPRAVWLWPGTPKFGTARFVENLGGKWAPSPDYGTRVAAVVARLRGA